MENVLAYLHTHSLHVIAQELGSIENLPAVAVQAFPVEDDVDDADESQSQQLSGLGQLLNIFSTTPTKTAQGGLCCAAKRI